MAEPGNVCPNCESLNIEVGDGVMSAIALQADERRCRVCFSEWVVRDDGSLHFVYDFGPRGA